MKILSLLLLTHLFVLNFAIGQNGIQSTIDNFKNDPALNSASISFKVINLSDNSTVAQVDPNRALPTASTAKLFSTATALSILGPKHQAETRIYHDGAIDSLGVLHGNLWIRGGGDPSLGSKYFNSKDNANSFLKSWTEKLKTLGIIKIEGAIIADASEFGYNGVPDGWNWVDLGNYYGAGPSGLTIYDNLLEVYFKTNGNVGSSAKINSIHPNVPDLAFRNSVQASTKRGDNVYIYGGPYSLDRFAIGTLPTNSSNFLVKGSIPNPELQFAFEFFKTLNAQGIKVENGYKSYRQAEMSSLSNEYSNRTLLFSHKGKELIEIINVTNMRSVNLFAEHMLNLIGYKKSGNGSTKKGLSVLESYWQPRFSTTGMQINDGSGLSRMNAISATHFVDLLAQMNKSKYSTDFYNSLPVAGKTGTLRNVCKGGSANGRMAAKSGSMTRIKSYAGYIDSVNGKRYAFALIVNNYTCSSSALRRKMEVVFNKIAAQ